MKGVVLGTVGENVGVDGAILSSSVNVVGPSVDKREVRVNKPTG